MKKEIRQSRLTIREQGFRKTIINYSWKHFKNNLTMEELSNIFRMPLAQFYKIVQTLKINAKTKN